MPHTAVDLVDPVDEAVCTPRSARKPGKPDALEALTRITLLWPAQSSRRR